VSPGSRISCFQQLVSDSSKCTHDDYRLHAGSAAHNTDEAPNCRSVFDRSAAKLHHDYIVASLKSALSPTHTVQLRFSFSFSLSLSLSLSWHKTKTHRQMSLLAVGSGKFTYISYIIRCHPPEDT
jgi:hypothetical protein